MARTSSASRIFLGGVGVAMSCLCTNTLKGLGRAGGIRTRDLFVPNEALY
jgi:hypothetical protein